MTEKRPATVREIRSFAVVVALGLSVLGALAAARRGVAAREVAILWGAAGALVLGGLLVPQVLRPVHRVWMAVGHVLGWVNTRLILGTTFFGLCLPIGTLMRLTGRDPLQLRRRPGGSYWIVRPPADRPADRYRRLF